MRGRFAMHTIKRLTSRSFMANLKQDGYLLPTVIALGLGISIVSILALQTVAQNSKTLNDQYYSMLAREAAQAGTNAAAACIRAGTTTWSANAKPLTPATDCTGTVVPSQPATIVDPVIDSSDYASTYSVGALQVVTPTSTIVTSVGTISVKSRSGTTVKTYTKSIRTYAKTTASSGRTSKVVDSISTGQSTTCALAGGWVDCWGLNDTGQLGIGISSTDDHEAFPKDVASNTATIPAYGGVAHTTCIIPVVLCSTTYNPKKIPAQPISALMNSDGTRKVVTQVSVGATHVCAIAKDNIADTTGATRKAYCWGDNTNGQLGNRSTTTSWVPVAVDTQSTSALYGKTITDISAGDNFTCALTTDATTACWGLNDNGQLGTNNRTASNIPKIIYSSNAYTVAGYCQWSWPWGTCGNYIAAVNYPATALWGKTVKKLARLHGGATMCVTDTNDTAYCWGQNYSGQVGNGAAIAPSNYYSRIDQGDGCNYPDITVAPNTAVDVLQPAAVQTALKFDSIVIGGSNPSKGNSAIFVTARTTTASTNPNRLYYWGGISTYSETHACYSGYYNSSDPPLYFPGSAETDVSRTYSGSSSPVGPLYDSATGTGLNKKAIALFAGVTKTGMLCAKTGSDLYCDANAGLGAQIVYATAPGWLAGKTVTSVDASNNYVCVVADQTVGCWGNNANGQLGDGTFVNRTVPTSTDVTVSSQLGVSGGVSPTFDNPMSF